jgi:lipopolysaccharide export system protein LptA
MSFVKIMRITVVVLFVVVLAVIGRYFMVRSQDETGIPVKTDEIVQKKVEKREKPEHFEFNGEERSLHVKADKQFIAEDGNYHAEGSVEITFFKEREGQDVILYGGKVIYDKDMTRFRSSDQAKARFKDLLVESILLNYANEEENFWTEEGVRLSSRRLTGTAQKLYYQMKQEILKLQGDVDLQIEPKTETSSTLKVTGRMLDYNEKSKQGKVEGNVQLIYGESRASAEIMKFELFPDGEQIKTLILERDAWASLVAKENESSPSPDQSLLFVQSVKREIEGEEIRMRFFQENSELKEVEAQGESSFKFISSTGDFTRVLAESAKFIFDSEGELEEFQAFKNAKIVKQAENPDEARLIEGDSFHKKKNSDSLHIKGKGPYDAKMSSLGNNVFAEEMTVFLDSSNLEVRRGVKVILKSKTGEKRPVGIFSKEQPVFIQAREMRYFADQKRFLFNRDIKTWQQKKVLSAEEMELFDETGQILCSGRVESTLPHTTKEGKEEKIKISSQKMMYLPEENLVVYQEKGSLIVKDATLQARIISVYLGEENKGIQKIVARERVIILQSMGEARGEEAIYNPEEESLELLGNPVFIDKDKGKTEGDKLTFYMADGRILVENKDRERSVTVIKRER